MNTFAFTIVYKLVVASGFVVPSKAGVVLTFVELEEGQSQKSNSALHTKPVVAIMFC